MPLQLAKGLEGWLRIAVKALARFEAEFSPCNLVQQELEFWPEGQSKPPLTLCPRSLLLNQTQ
jgi:hypothetical protein